LGFTQITWYCYISEIKKVKMGWMYNLRGEEGTAYTVLMRKPIVKHPVGKMRKRWRVLL
jgi:hypothetical protein